MNDLDYVIVGGGPNNGVGNPFERAFSQRKDFEESVAVSTEDAILVRHRESHVGKTGVEETRRESTAECRPIINKVKKSEEGIKEESAASNGGKSNSHVYQSIVNQ